MNVISSLQTIGAIWLAVDGLILLTIWVGMTLIQRRYPVWWTNNICAPMPASLEAVPLHNDQPMVLKEALHNDLC